MNINKKYAEMINHTNVFSKVLWENPLYNRGDKDKPMNKEQKAVFDAVLACEAILEKNLLKGFAYYLLIDSRIQSECIWDRAMAEGRMIDYKKDRRYQC